MKCHNCGKEVKIGSCFCDACGSQLEKEQVATIPDKLREILQDEKKRKYALIAIIGCAILAIIILFSGERLATRQEIKEQIIEFEQFDEMIYPMEIKEYEEYHRVTDKEAKSDEIWVAIEADNGYVQLKAAYHLTYFLFGNGWQCMSIDFADNHPEFSERTYLGLNEVDIVGDISNHFRDILEEYNFTFLDENVEIINTQDSNEGKDLICNITVSNDNIDASAIVEVKYLLDMARGYVFDTATLREYTIMVKEGPSEAIQKSSLEKYGKDYTVISNNKTSNTQYEYHYQVTDSLTCENLIVVWEIVHLYDYDIDNGWNLTSEEKTVLEVTPNLNGKWKYIGDKGQYINMTISEADSDSVSYSFDFLIKETTVWMKEQTCQLSTNSEVKTKTWSCTYDTEKDCISLKTNERIFSVAWSGGLSDTDYYLEYKAYSDNKSGSGLYIGERLLQKQ